MKWRTHESLRFENLFWSLRTNEVYWYAKLIVLSWCSFNKSWGIATCKGIQDSLGFRIPRNGFRILGSGFRILGQCNLDSGFQSLQGFQIPWDVYSVFQSLGLRIIQQKSAGSRILQAKISLVPESGIPYWVEGICQWNPAYQARIHPVQ